MTSESSASPVSPSLRGRIAEHLYDVINEFECEYDDGSEEAMASLPFALADAVVALLGLKEEHDTFGGGPYARLVGPWYPVNPDSSEGTT